MNLILHAGHTRSYLTKQGFFVNMAKSGFDFEKMNGKTIAGTAPVPPKPLDELAGDGLAELRSRI